MKPVPNNTKETAVADIDHAQDIVQVLQAQHDQVRELLKTIDHAPEGHRAEPFRDLVQQLKAHEAAEESVVYPALCGLGSDAAAVVDRRVAEEKEAEKVIASLEKMDTESKEFGEKFAKFHEAVEKHASAEEAEIFPLLSNKMAEDVRRAMGSSLLRAEEMHG